MSHARMSASSVAHKSTGGTLQSLPEPVDPVGDAPDYLTFKTVALLRQRVFSFRDSLICCVKNAHLAGIRHPRSTGELVSSGFKREFWRFLSVCTFGGGLSL